MSITREELMRFIEGIRGVWSSNWIHDHSFTFIPPGVILTIEVIGESIVRIRDQYKFIGWGMGWLGEKRIDVSCGKYAGDGSPGHKWYVNLDAYECPSYDGDTLTEAAFRAVLAVLESTTATEQEGG